MPSFFETLLSNELFRTALAGAAGGVVRWLTLRDDLKEGIANIVVGGLCAIYMGPYAVAFVEKWTGIAVTDQGGNLGAFMVGLFGMALAGFLIDVAKFARRKQLEQMDDDNRG